MEGNIIFCIEINPVTSLITKKLAANTYSVDLNYLTFFTHITTCIIMWKGNLKTLLCAV